MASHLPEGLSPDAVDTLTELTSIITKLRSANYSSQPAGLSTPAFGGLANLPGAAPTSAPPHGGAGSASQSQHNQTQQQPSGTTPAPGAVTGTTPLPSGPSVPGNTTGGALSVKELPAATDNLKHKLQRARAAVKTLPDVGRSIAQQEIEIRELEDRRRKQIAMLTRLREKGLQLALHMEQSKRDEGDRMVVE
ncbi:RNA polymerase II transcription mediator complex subunit 9-domain-containing protein [Apodospora peruviana]|uniref:Mediator of RNA polymerase II transcription subunit 9 n=1 Tax=Apodospora peruviana TaxID=516989 RepID=A0AAE0M6W9_9PEZI|nr:RNA polymerase II transcription mediator complex subunit 9-domain-containing protein [Apodospora peruviana]